MRGWYRRHVALDSNRSSTWTSGAGLARDDRRLRADDGEQWVASVLLDGEYGLHDVATGVPGHAVRGRRARHPGMGTEPRGAQCAS